MSQVYKQDDSRTTLRTNVTEYEHDAVRNYAKNILGTTLDAFVLEAVKQHIERLSGESLEKLAERIKNRGRIVQEELF